MKNYIKFSLLFLQAIAIICVVVILNFFIIYRVFIRLLGFCLCVRLFSKQIIFAYKTLYVIFICFFPSLGILFYLLNSVNNCKKLVIPKLKKNNKNLTNCSKTSNYIRTAFSGLEYPAENLRYYADGKKYFNALFWQIKNAKNFILLQYFIVKDGKLLTELFSLLKDKSASGVKVYFLYDAFGSMKMEKQIIKFAFDNKINAKSFNPIGYIISSKINNRHHGKIAVIDGKIGFLGRKRGRRIRKRT